MNYIVFDLEFNQVCPPTTDAITMASKQCPFEIVQIGAVKLNEQLEIQAHFSRLVKPTIYTSMNPFVSKLTRITTDDLVDQQTFPHVFADFSTFMGTEELIFCIWGMSDMKELYRNLRFHQIDALSLPQKYLNLQPYTSEFLDLPTSIALSLKNGIDFLDIPMEMPLHDAYNDAYFTAKIFQTIYKPTMVPQIYTYSESVPAPRVAIKKKRTDTERLLNQFKKMYARELTEEEIGIIKLAYVMGKTHQFEVE